MSIMYCQKHDRHYDSDFVVECADCEHEPPAINIRTSFDPPPIPLRDHDWSAIDADTYDGAEDSSNRYMIGWGATKEAAIADLAEKLAEREE